MCRLAIVCALSTLFWAPAAEAQEASACESGTAQATLDVAGARAVLTNRGPQFHPPPGSNVGIPYFYEVPKGSGIQSLWTYSLLLAGLVNNEPRSAGRSYRSAFWPGPYPTANATADDCSSYNRIWSVRRSDLTRYLQTGDATTDLLEWPFHLGAPVIDGDGDPDNYDLEAGDQPALRGDQTLWWLVNDANPDAPDDALGVEVRVEAFAKASSDAAINEATFYRYTLTNTTDAPIDSLHAGFFLDSDLGAAYDDDYFGTDTTLSLWYAYKGIDEDRGGFGAAPPALGLTFVETPVALPDGRDNDGDGAVDEPGERGSLLASFRHADDGPTTPLGTYNALQGRQDGGTPFREGFQPDGEATTIMFPAEPGDFWSGPCAYPNCNPSLRTDSQQCVVSGSPFELAPGESKTVTVALVYARGTDHLDSVRALRDATREVRTAYDLGLFEPQAVADSEPPPIAGTYVLGAPFPNPATRAVTVPYRVPAAQGGSIRITVSDVLGREVAVVVEGLKPPGAYEAVLNTSAFAPGVYIVRMEHARASVEVQRFTVVR
ncbi:MAG: T9SS type A sorting domain-containing protein [Bacteroidota bacterium]